MLEAYREFAREQTVRFERMMRALSEEIRLQREESRRYFEHLDTRLDALHQESRELQDQSRAQTQALLRVIDRLDNGGTAPAA